MNCPLCLNVLIYSKEADGATTEFCTGGARCWGPAPLSDFQVERLLTHQKAHPLATFRPKTPAPAPTGDQGVLPDLILRIEFSDRSVEYRGDAVDCMLQLANAREFPGFKGYRLLGLYSKEAA